MAQSSSLPQPPKFSGKMGPAPMTLADWVQFFRWLINLWRKAEASIDAPQALTIAQPSIPGARLIDGAAARALSPQQFPTPHVTDPAQFIGMQSPPVSRETANLRFFESSPIPTPRADELNTLAAYLLAKPPYPTRTPPPVITDTHAHRANYPAAQYPGHLYFETSQTIPDTNRTALYVSNNGLWEYAGGIYRDAIANIPGDLGANDAGFQFEAADFSHRYEWDGAAWAYAPGDPGSGFIGWYTEAPNAGDWHAADGTAGVTRSLPAGTTATVTVPDLRGAYPKGGTVYTGAQVAASAPSFGGSLGIAAAATGVSVNTTGTAAVLVTSSGAVQVAAEAHTHAVLDPTHTHALTGSGAVGSNGEPLHLVLLPYYRL